jgi:hypothetical protein
MANYKNGIIYKICCNDVNITDCYVGSTCSFRARKCAHKGSCTKITNKKYNYNVYQFIRANGGWDNWTMVQIEQYKAKDKRDLHSRERFHMEQLNSTLNKQVPTQTVAESNKKYKENNKDKISLQKKEYYEKNKDKIKDKLKKPLP